MSGMEIMVTAAIVKAREDDWSSFSMRGWGECLYTLTTDNMFEQHPGHQPAQP